MLSAFAGAGAGCGGERKTASADGVAVPVDSMGAAPTNVATIALHARPTLVENSALAMSRQQAGVLFSINDSGNEAVLFAIDTLGADRGTWRVKQSKNVDWEALSIGPCASGSSTGCIYIGDVGDNDEKHPTRTIYRVTEPDVKDSTFSGTVSADHVEFSYSDRRHDVEAMYVAPNGDMFLITKRPLRTLLRRMRPALVFRVPASAWTSKKPVVAELVDSLSIVPGSAPLRVVTDASLSADGARLVVRTYTQAFVYATSATTGRVNHSVTPAICNLTSLGEAQGEGIAWVAATGRLAFSTEGRAAPLHLANCPVP